jgi:hypothetical protein
MATQRLPNARNLGEAIEGSASLASLLAGHRRSQECFAVIQGHLPPGLREQVRTGPIEGVCWTLFVENGAAAAKLRQSLPRLLAIVGAHDRAIAELKLKIQPREGRR